MLIFAVIGAAQSDALDANVTESYPSNRYPLAPNVWLVADTANTTQEVCEKLNVKPGGIQDVVVLRFESYFGFAHTSVWEWLRRRERTDVASRKYGTSDQSPTESRIGGSNQ
jgi:hypothetical protein